MNLNRQANNAFINQFLVDFSQKFRIECFRKVESCACTYKNSMIYRAMQI
jgi:hypothetical protein